MIRLVANSKLPRFVSQRKALRRESFAVFLTVCAVIVLSGCGPTKNSAKREKPVAKPENSSIVAPGPIVANGTDTLNVSIVLHDQNDAPMAKVTPVLSVTGTGNTVGVCSETDGDGVSSCTVTSTKAEIKTINLSAPSPINGVDVEFVAGPAAKLGFSSQPADGTVGELLVIQPVVEVQDAHGNRVPAATNSVALSLAAGTGALTGTTTKAAVSGVATFTDISTTSDGVKSLKAAATGLTAATSANFTMAAATGLRLVYAVQPGGGGAGTTWSQQPKLEIQTAGGTVATSKSSAVTLTLTSGSGVLLGTKTVSAVSGVATFSGLKMEAVGSKALTATASGISNAISNVFTISPGAPGVLAFSTQPGGGVANQVWSQQPVVKLYDAYGNFCVNNSSASVALALQSGTGAITGTTTVTAASGVATFAGLKMQTAGAKTLRATSGTLNVDSTSFTVTPATASLMVYTAQPSGGTAGIAWPTQPAIEVRDAYANRATSFAGTIGLALTSGTGAILGTTSMVATSGVATFSGLKTNVAGNDKVLTASATGLSSITSGTFSVAVGALSQMIVKVQPSSNDIANTVLSTQPKIELQDSFGNKFTSGTLAVVASLQSGDGLLLGQGTMAVVSGEATFLDLKVSTPGSKVLRFTKPNMIPLGGTGELTVDSTSFTAVIGAAAKLAFATQPSGGTAGVAWSTQPVVEVQDVAGNRVTTASGTMSLALASGTGSLLGTLSAVASSGRATWTNVKMNDAGAKTIRVSSGTLATATSNSLTVTHASASQMALSVQPVGGTHSQALPTQPVIRIKDAFGNTVTSGVDSTADVTATLLTGTGSLSGTATVTAVSGVATFADLSIDQVGSKTLRFAKEDTTGLSGTSGVTTDSNALTVSAGAEDHLAMVTEANGAVAGAAFTTQPVIEILDSAGNRVTSSTATVTAALINSTGNLLGTTSVTAVGGVATFSNLKIDLTGIKSIEYSASGLTSVTGSDLTVIPGIATQLVLTSEPSSGVVNSVFSTQPVIQIQDAQGNVVSTGVDATATVTVSLGSGTGALAGTQTLAAVAGVVSFTNLKATTIGAKTLHFVKSDTSGSGGTAPLSVDGTSFTVAAGSGVQLVFTTQPGGGISNQTWATQPVVEIRDALGNVDTSSTATVSLGLTTGAGTLGGTTSVNAVAGVATFTDLTVNLIGSDKVVTATAPGLTSAASNSFAITAGTVVAASTVGVSVTSLWADGADTSTVTVTAKDSAGNVASGRTVSLTSSRGGTDTITTSPAVTNASGVATFTVKSSTAGSSTLTLQISEGAVTLTTQPVLTFVDAAISLSQSSWNLDRVSTANDGISAVTLNGTLKNAAGTALPNKTVQLASSRGASDVLSSSTTTTDAGGAFAFTVKSAVAGVSTLTVTVPAEAFTLTNSAKAQFLAVQPESEWLSSLASTDAGKMIAGKNSSPQVSTWVDVASGGTADGALSGFSYDTTTSGWRGDGGTTISNGVSGPYRLGFDGSDDRVDFGTSMNAWSSLTIEAWLRPEGLASQTGRTVLGNAAATTGMQLRLAKDKTKRWETLIGGAGVSSQTYAEEILADSPAGYWRLSEASGTTAISSSGTLAQVTFSGGVTVNQAGALNSNDKAYVFDGTSGRIQLGNAYASSTGSYTLSAWIRLGSSVTSVARTIAARGDSSGGVALEVNTGQNVTLTTSVASSPVVVTGTTALAVETWYHVVGVRNVDFDCAGAAGKHIAVYLNGSRESCTDLADVPDSESGTFVIGNHPVLTTHWFPGAIDEVAVYPSALSSARISAQVAAAQVPTCYSAPLADLTWSHVIFGFAAGGELFRMQVNGTETCNVIASGADISGSTAHFGLGARLANDGSLVAGTAWKGAVSEVRIYQRGLGSLDAATHFSALSPVYP